MKKKRKIEIFFDGSCTPTNPGGTAISGLAVIIDNKIIYRESVRAAKGREATSNVAEWAGFHAAVKWLIKHGNPAAIIKGDSKMVVNQAQKTWKIKKGKYLPFALAAMQDLQKLEPQPEIKWVPREENTTADNLASLKFLEDGIDINMTFG